MKIEVLVCVVLYTIWFWFWNWFCFFAFCKFFLMSRLLDDEAFHELMQRLHSQFSERGETVTHRHMYDKKADCIVSGNDVRPSKKRKRTRCGMCYNCTLPDCGRCQDCLDKLSFNGTGKRKRGCGKRPVCGKYWLIRCKSTEHWILYDLNSMPDVLCYEWCE